MLVYLGGGLVSYELEFIYKIFHLPHAEDSKIKGKLSNIFYISRFLKDYVRKAQPF